MIYRQNFFRIKIFKRIEFVSKSRKDGRRMKFNLHIGAPILAGERFNSPSHSFSATATTKDSPGDWFRWRCTHVSDFRRCGLSSLWLAFWKIQAQWTQWNKFSENATEFVWMSKAFYWHLKASEENECDFLKAEKCEMCARWMAAKRRPQPLSNRREKGTHLRHREHCTQQATWWMLSVRPPAWPQSSWIRLASNSKDFSPCLKERWRESLNNLLQSTLTT